MRGVATPGHGKGEGSAGDKFRVSGTQETVEGPERRCPKGIEAKFPSCIVFSLPKHYNGRPRSRGVFAASENKSTLLQEVEKRHEHGVHITKMRCAELDGAARLRLNFCD